MRSDKIYTTSTLSLIAHTTQHRCARCPQFASHSPKCSTTHTKSDRHTPHKAHRLTVDTRQSHHTHYATHTTPQRCTTHAHHHVNLPVPARNAAPHMQIAAHMAHKTLIATMHSPPHSTYHTLSLDSVDNKTR